MHAVDHVFVFCRSGAPEVEALQRAGLPVGLRREHQGQGTANLCIGFAGCYLELLWLADETAARDPHVKPLGRHERSRWRDNTASPFGVAVRPTTPGGAPPFVPWDYTPRYLPPQFRIEMACNSGVLGEPMLFQVDRPWQPFGPPHALRERAVAEVRLTVPNLAPRSLLREVQVPGLVIADGPHHRLELTFAGNRTRQLDLAPALPVALHF
jgi:hypothetical protein